MISDVKAFEDSLKDRVSKSEFRVLRRGGTEAPFTNEYFEETSAGVYVCKACLNPLFNSTTKFSSSSGWPSFYDAIPGSVVIEEDRSFGMLREEVRCATCASHLGHIFPDGPAPTGARYCMNSASLQLRKEA